MVDEKQEQTWSPNSLLENHQADYCLMLPVLVGEGRRQLLAAGFTAGPATGSSRFEIWISHSGFPQMVPYSDFPLNQSFDGEELSHALLSR